MVDLQKPIRYWSKNGDRRWSKDDHLRIRSWQITLRTKSPMPMAIPSDSILVCCFPILLEDPCWHVTPGLEFGGAQLTFCRWYMVILLWHLLSLRSHTYVGPRTIQVLDDEWILLVGWIPTKNVQFSLLLRKNPQFHQVKILFSPNLCCLTSYQYIYIHILVVQNLLI